MEIFNTLAQFLSKIVQWWFTVMPWEQAIHVRRGKHVRVKEKGLYFKVPFIDQVYIQTTRMRTVEVPMQNVTSKDGHCASIGSYITYVIADILVLYKTLYHPERTLGSILQGHISEYVRARDIKEVDINQLEQYCTDKMKENNYGLKDIGVRINNFAVVKTFRLIQDNSYNYSEGLKMEPLK